MFGLQGEVMNDLGDDCQSFMDHFSASISDFVLEWLLEGYCANRTTWRSCYKTMSSDSVAEEEVLSLPSKLDLNEMLALFGSGCFLFGCYIIDGLMLLYLSNIQLA
ncbi:hypothetical protein GOP47_0001269 [Adiantum capillus-veneris]|uniref:Uncharacterized protein n=1 Tax=Adiantum capillus-veneris TaxID=13818 RepID=A0A9D4VFI5_ADICA|nr:hypothetical protein GOP47_0001269 [Adiantum capillus-veneris]